AQIEEIVVIAPDRARLDADARVVERFNGRQPLGEEPCLHLFCNFQFLGSSAFGFELLGSRPPLRFDFPAHVVDAHQPEGITVHVFEAGEYSAPSRRLLAGQYRRHSRTRGKFDALQARRGMKANPALAPLVELGDHVFSQENNLRSSADELYPSEPGLGAISARSAVPSGGATNTQRPPDGKRLSKTRWNPSC